ncbi:RNA polymerase sigma factor [Lysinibacter cavernae]|uniref:RNA polymerase sigma factor (Sigma-70 family) n=1 Tax=Lysinibacter cavernae TaxID=1640652 RepID=A0A7X5TTM1_9MICO|nr:sigma-70 family RNA polymerase sigma factor [Lysinibacter cavernae]NIH53664.1 RNA polymerase sigma factor (sigma-70 family) [Lysinibacter cavernae]
MENEETTYTPGFEHDQELLARHRSGDPKAYGLLFEKYQKVAFAYAYRYVDTPELAEDLVLESFTRILETIGRGNGPTVSMGHYLASTIRNVGISGGIRQSNEQSRDPLEVARLFEHEHFNDRAETSEWLGEAFNQLEPRAQQIMWHRVVEGETSRELAKQLGLNPITVTRLYQAAARQLREAFVGVSLNAARNPECKQMAPFLLGIARRSKKERLDPIAPELDAHLASCRHCSVVFSRLMGSDKALLSIILLAGLGTLGADSLATTPAAASLGTVIAGLSIPLKVAIVAVPLIAASVVGVVVSQLWADASPARASSITIGKGTTSAQPSLLIGTPACGIQREPVDDRSEIWRVLDGGPSCEVRVELRAEGSPVVLLDSAQTQAVEVTRAGTYSVTVAEGKTLDALTVTVTPTME